MNLYSELINRRVGLINYLEPVPFNNMSKHFYRYMANIKQNFSVKEYPGTGFSSNKELAINKAVGEAMERYSSIIPNSDIIIIDSYTKLKKSLKESIVSPEEFNRYNDVQYERNTSYEKFKEGSIRKWVKGVNYITQEYCYLPFETVYLLIPELHKPFRDIVSTGLACGTSFEHAFENSLTECIERDAYLNFWMLGKNNYEIDLKYIDSSELNIYLNSIVNLNYSVRLFDISQDDIKAFTILTVISTVGEKGFYTATSTDRNLFKAIKGSLEEGISGYSAFRERIQFYDLVPPDTLDDIRSLEDHASYYVAGKYDEIMDKLLETNVSKIKISNLNTEYTFEEMINSVKEITDIYYVDITPVDIEELNLKCLRVVTPELLFLPFGNEFLLEANRLKKLSNGRELNVTPHSFP